MSDLILFKKEAWWYISKFFFFAGNLRASKTVWFLSSSNFWYCCYVRTTWFNIPFNKYDSSYGCNLIS